MTLNDATLRQIEAADPTQSTWLSANAGSGKTRVLTDRVARLLLDGTRPENILCLTYTKAAASEMQNRLFKRLGEWAMMPASDLRKQLSDLGALTSISEADLSQARRLFARAIETPGGLKIQTIHSFCAGILRRFPLEASVSPLFKEMEDRMAQILREDVLDEMALGEHADALAGFAALFSGAEASEILAAVTARKSAFITPPDDDALANRLGLVHGTDQRAACAVAFTGGEADLANDLRDAAQAAPASYQKFAATLAALPLDKPDLETLRALFDLFLTKGQRRKWPTANHKKAWEAFDHLLDDMFAWMDRVAAAHDYLLAIDAFHRTRALIAFAQPFVALYEEKKEQRAALDFDDLILKAKALLEDDAVAQWVLFRLDGGVDHVLVDEAQDTSPDQWDIVRLLTQEFSTGEGAQPDRERTIFVVGDKKQSIYSFQGADPEGFDRMKHHFSGELEKVQKRLQNAELAHSFRSSAAILTLVDQTFAGPMAAGLGDRIEHLAFRDDMPGRVDVWPVIEPLDAPEEREWDDPVDLKGQTNHKVILANRVASEIKRMLAEETLPVETEQGWARRPITPGDFLILVQGRMSGIFDLIIATCKAEGLDVAGADRLKLGGELAVKDISALLKFLALQEDDLSLAAALRSPLFGWSEKQLYDLAQPRAKGQTLWEALRKSGQHDDTLEVIRDLRDSADYLRPYDLINRILIRHSGRQSLLARLGHEAEDGIDALLSQALGYEQSAVPSLTGFLSWLESEDVTVKRQLDAAGDRIRVMTVHGAKGLEAPIVILPETAERQRRHRGELLDSADFTFWKSKSEHMPQVLRTLQEDALDAQDRERRRLLYVAMTRAENWLIVAAAGRAEDPEKSWHAAVSSAMGHLDAIDHDTAFGTIKRLSRWDWEAGPMVEASETDNGPDPLPGFPPVLPALPDGLVVSSPSDLGGAKIMPGDTDEDASEAALALGRITHLLLEVLPNTAPDQRMATARSLAENHPDAGLIAGLDAVIDEALTLISRDDLNWIFATGLAEVPVSAPLSALGDVRIYGILDRLIVAPDEVICVDYKTNRIVPGTADETPIGLVRQMAAYRDALRLVYPGKPLRCLILWTVTGDVMELPDSALDLALQQVAFP